MTHRILIIRLSALGDILHGLPVLAALREAFPDAHLGWLVEDRGAPLLRHQPLLDRLHVLPRDLMKKDLKRNPLAALRGPLAEFAGRLRREKYTISIDLQGLTKSACWGRIAGARMRIGFRGEDARELSRWFYNEAVEPSPDCVHVVHRNLALLKPLDVVSPSVRFPFQLDEAALGAGRRMWGLPGRGDTDGRPRVVLNVGAGWPTKAWPAKYFGELGARLARDFGARVAIAWGPGEEEAARTALLTARSGAGSRSGKQDPSSGVIGAEAGIYRLPSTSFLELGGVIAAAGLYVGGDTGPTHMAAALGIPVVSPFGGSDARRNRPLGAPGQTIQLDDPPCVPCWKTRCEWREPLACLTHIKVDRVASACEPFLRRG